MLKYFLILVGMCVSFPLYAMEDEDDMNVVIFSQKQEKQSHKIYLPTCVEQGMIDMVSDQIREYLDNHREKGIFRHRKQALMLKNLKKFDEVDVANFNHKDNYEVARKLIMTKINYRIEEENIRLCRSNSDVYLLIYPEGYGYRVQIMNFANSLKDEEDFSLFYEMDKDEAENPETDEMQEGEKVLENHTNGTL